MVDKKVYESYLSFDKPIPFNGITLHFSKMEDYYDFYTCIDVLLFDKNKIPDISIIKMSYLDYLFYMLNSDDEKTRDIMSYKLITLFRIILNISTEESYSAIGYIRYDNYTNITINGIEFDKDLFNDFRKLVCIMHDLELPEENMLNPDVEKALKEAREFKNKNKKKLGTLEEQIICVMAKTSYDVDNIAKMSIRKFQRLLKRIDFVLHYEIYKTAEMSGQVEFKQEIDHWMTTLEVQDDYSDVISDYNGFKGRFNGINVELPSE